MIRLLIYGMPGTPIFEVSEFLSNFHEIDSYMIEGEDSECESYFSDKIPTSALDVGDFSSGSASESLPRDPAALSKEKALDSIKVKIIDSMLDDEELESVNELEEGILATEIPDVRLLDWATHIVFLNTDVEEAIAWFSLRKKCPSCGSVYHVTDKPERYENICDRCGTILIRKPEDDPEFVKANYKEWRKEFNLIDHRAKKNKNYIMIMINRCEGFDDIIIKIERWMRKTLGQRINWSKIHQMI